MDLKEAMQARHSVRQYKDQPLSCLLYTSDAADE